MSTKHYYFNLHVDPAYARSIEPDLLEQALRLTLQAFNNTANTDATIINLTITDDETIQRLNYQFRGVNTPTDVLSFPNIPDPEFPNVDQDHLGDIIIGYPVAESQARAGGHPPMAELILLAVHGALHLLDFDHDTPAAKAQMWTAQQKILAELGLKHIQPTEK